MSPDGERDPEPDPTIGPIAFHASTFGAARSLFRSAVCTYVGRDGIARYTRGLRGKVRAEVVLFADVRELRVTHDAPPPGAHARRRSTWAFHTTDVAAAALAIEARPRADEVAPPEAPFWFGAAAERAYSEHVLARHEDELAAHGRIRFALSPRDVVAVGAGFLELEQHGARARFDATEVRLVEVLRGHLVVKTGESGSAALGIHRLKIEDPRAVHALAIVLQELAGLRMG